MATWAFFFLGFALAILILYWLVGPRPRWFAILLVAMVGARAEAAGPPAGAPDEFRFSFSGNFFTSDPQDTLPSGQGSHIIKWNGTNWTWAERIADWDNTWDLTPPSGSGANWVSSITIANPGMSELWYAIWVSPTISGPWTLDDAQLTFIPPNNDNESVTYGLSDFPQSANYDWGKPSIADVKSVQGTQYVEAAFIVRILWQQADKLWRDAEGKPVAPLGAIVETEHRQRLKAAVRTNAPSPNPVPITTSIFLPPGWRPQDYEWSIDHYLPVGTAVSAGGSFTTPMMDLPVRWEAAPLRMSSFGGYAVTGLDVQRVQYDEIVARVQYEAYNSTTTPGQYEEKSEPHSVLGIKRVVGVPPERWLLVAATESDTRRPYMEVRKQSGERVRFYLSGHLLASYKVFRFEADGITPHSQLKVGDWNEQGGNGAPGSTVSEYSGFQLGYNATGGAELLVFPSEGLPDGNATTRPTTYPTTSPTFAQDVVGGIVGDGNDSNGTGSLLDKAKATTMPTFFNFMTTDIDITHASVNPPADLATITAALVGSQTNMPSTGWGSELFRRLGGAPFIAETLVYKWVNLTQDYSTLFTILKILATGILSWHTFLSIVAGLMRSIGMKDISLINYLRIGGARAGGYAAEVARDAWELTETDIDEMSGGVIETHADGKRRVSLQGPVRPAAGSYAGPMYGPGTRSL